MDDNWNEGTEFKHYGKGHLDGGHSGRLPWGYGQRPYQSLEGTAEYDRLMKNKNASSGSSREAYVQKSKQSNNRDGNSSPSHAERPASTRLGARGTPHSDVPYEKVWKSTKKEEYHKTKEAQRNNDHHQNNDYRRDDKPDYKKPDNRDAVKALEDKVKQLEQEKAALESKKTGKKGIKALLGKKDKDELKIEKKSRKELMNMSPKDLSDYINKLNNVNNALNLQSPTRKFLTQQGNELARAISKDVAIPAMTRFVKQGIYSAIKSSNDKKEKDKKLEDSVVKWLANYNPNPGDKTGQVKNQGDGGGGNNKGNKGNRNKNKGH